MGRSPAAFLLLAAAALAQTPTRSPSPSLFPSPSSYPLVSSMDLSDGVSRAVELWFGYVALALAALLLVGGCSLQALRAIASSRPLVRFNMSAREGGCWGQCLVLCRASLWLVRGCGCRQSCAIALYGAPIEPVVQKMFQTNVLGLLMLHRLSSLAAALSGRWTPTPN